MYHSDVDADSGADCVGMGAEGILEISILSAQFSCEPKIALKKEILF